MSVTSVVEKLMEPIVKKTGTQLIDVIYEQENNTWYLRVFIDTDQGLTMDECVEVTELISAKLDEEDFIKEEYMLEVSSPGAERPLKSLEAITNNIGKHANIQVHEPINEIKEFQGDLLSVNENEITLECLFKTRKKKVIINYNNVKKARLAVKF